MKLQIHRFLMLSICIGTSLITPKQNYKEKFFLMLNIGIGTPLITPNQNYKQKFLTSTSILLNSSLTDTILLIKIEEKSLATKTKNKIRKNVSLKLILYRYQRWIQGGVWRGAHPPKIFQNAATSGSGGGGGRWWGCQLCDCPY